jgi:Ser/Thr protein kinase RdoA (MazF antagonist)
MDDVEQQLIQMNTLVEAYEGSGDFYKTQLTLIEPLRTMRMVNYMA